MPSIECESPSNVAIVAIALSGVCFFLALALPAQLPSQTPQMTHSSHTTISMQHPLASSSVCAASASFALVRLNLLQRRPDLIDVQPLAVFLVLHMPQLPTAIEDQDPTLRPDVATEEHILDVHLGVPPLHLGSPQREVDVRDLASAQGLVSLPMLILEEGVATEVRLVEVEHRRVVHAFTVLRDTHERHLLSFRSALLRLLSVGSAVAAVGVKQHLLLVRIELLHERHELLAVIATAAASWSPDAEDDRHGGGLDPALHLDGGLQGIACQLVLADDAESAVDGDERDAVQPFRLDLPAVLVLQPVLDGLDGCLFVLAAGYGDDGRALAVVAVIFLRRHGADCGVFRAWDVLFGGHGDGRR
mmetsp:Transcript_12062/g.33210  ORF Transcript_12062/g.33210 Transcript_12062/m.33210 type:complete len:361 (-) Transcript_12062:245-1327(-)